MTISVASAKAKGRKLQQTVRDAIRAAFPALDPIDVQSCPMGSAGDDVILSAAARAVFPYAVECKARAKGFTALYDYLAQADRKDGRTPIAVVKQDRREPLVVLRLDTFIRLVKP
jgi:hypothetical protein